MQNDLIFWTIGLVVFCIFGGWFWGKLFSYKDAKFWAIIDLLCIITGLSAIVFAFFEITSLQEGFERQGAISLLGFMKDDLRQKAYHLKETYCSTEGISNKTISNNRFSDKSLCLYLDDLLFDASLTNYSDATSTREIQGLNAFSRHSDRLINDLNNSLKQYKNAYLDAQNKDLLTEHTYKKDIKKHIKILISVALFAFSFTLKLGKTVSDFIGTKKKTANSVEASSVAINTQMKRLSEEQYKNLFGIDPNDKDKVEKALEHALDIRKFEIELYWKRATYFWALIAATFAVYFVLLGSKISDKDYLAYVVTCIGLLFTWAWFLVNRGSKHWQENWENHVDMLEDSIIGPLYKTVLCRPPEKDIFDKWVTGPLAISPSKTLQWVGLFTISIWFVLMYHTVEISIIPPWSTKHMVVGAITVLFGVLIFLKGRTWKGSFEHIAEKRETNIT